MSLMYAQNILTQETVTKINEMGLTAQKVADRWALGWPKRIKEMEKNGTFLPRLKDVSEYEASILSRARASGDMSHLADHEIAEMYDLHPAP